MPSASPYARYAQTDLTLRDLLAVERTIAANERTFLGYVRTTLGFLAAGGSLVHFVDALWATAVGISLLAISLPTFAIGLRHYLARRRALAPLFSAVDDND